jgi:hypothetical protein
LRMAASATPMRTPGMENKLSARGAGRLTGM